MWEVDDLIPAREEMEKALKERHGRHIQERFSAATVAIFALALARAGIGRLILIDHDRVDISNLHRQQYKAAQVGRYKTEALSENINEIAPYVKLEAHTVRITTENAATLLTGVHIVCEAFDRAESKAMLADVVLGTMPEKYLVAASGMAGLGRSDLIRTRKVTERFYLCGDGESDAADAGMFASRVMLCAAHQAHAVLRILANGR